MVDMKQLYEKANDLRKQTLEMCIKAKTGHVTSSFSCAELLTALYPGKIMRVDPKNPNWQDRDRFVLSKGQASPILYTTLADSGFFPREWLEGFATGNGHFGVHLQGDIPGVEYTMGSLGHGLGNGCGAALAAKMNLKDYHTFVLLGDAECYEGSVWEAAMFAGHHKLNNLTAIVDRNGYGVMGSTEEIVRLSPFEVKFKACGWDTEGIDGHSLEEIYKSLEKIRERKSQKPLAVIAETVKGKGIAFMENVSRWHGLAPLGEEAEKARQQLSEYSREVAEWTQKKYP